MKHIIPYILVGFILFISLCVQAQTSAIIDYRFYTTKEQPYMIPMPSGSDFTLIIKTGHPVYISIANMDKGSGWYYYASGNTKTITGDTILIESGFAGN